MTVYLKNFIKLSGISWGNLLLNASMRLLKKEKWALHKNRL